MNTVMRKAAASRIQFAKILLATDFSPASSTALRYAAEIARGYGAKLFVVNAVTPVVNPMTPPEGWPALEKAGLEYNLERTDELRKALPGIEHVVLIKEGDVWSNLKSVIVEQNIDLLVVGTRGHSTLGKVVIGSEAERIFREAPCPVMTVGPHSPSKPGEGAIQQILFATNFGPESLAAAPYALSFAEENQAYLTLLHVIEPPKPGEVVGAHELMASNARLLRDLVPEGAELWCVPDFLVEEGNVAEKILEVAQGRKADLIVLGARHPARFAGAVAHALGTIAYQVAERASCPVLTVRG